MVHHHNPIREAEGLLLVVGDKYHSDTQLLLELLSSARILTRRPASKLERGSSSRRILGPVAIDGPGGHPLLLPAGEFAHPAFSRSRKAP